MKAQCSAADSGQLVILMFHRCCRTSATGVAHRTFDVCLQTDGLLPACRTLRHAHLRVFPFGTCDSSMTVHHMSCAGPVHVNDCVRRQWWRVAGVQQGCFVLASEGCSHDAAVLGVVASTGRRMAVGVYLGTLPCTAAGSGAADSNCY